MTSPIAMVAIGDDAGQPLGRVERSTSRGLDPWWYLNCLQCPWEDTAYSVADGTGRLTNHIEDEHQ